MATIRDISSQIHVTPRPDQGPELAAAKKAELNLKTSNAMAAVLAEKETNKKKTLDGRVNFLEGVLVAGDLLTMGSMVLSGAQIINPALSSIPAVAAASFAFGALAGAVTIGVSILCLKSAIVHYRNGDKSTARRMLFNFIMYSSIGLIMMLSSLALKVGALSSVAAFFAANPWFLPVLFFIVGLPTFAEVVMRIHNARTKQDFGSKVLDNNLDKLLDELKLDVKDLEFAPAKPVVLDTAEFKRLLAKIEKKRGKPLSEDELQKEQEEQAIIISSRPYTDFNDKVDAAVEALESISEAELKIGRLDRPEQNKILKYNYQYKFFSEKLEKLSADMGVEAAIATFKLLQMYVGNGKQMNDAVKDQLKIAQKGVTKWNNSQYVRLTQRILYVAAFIFSMGMISFPQLNNPTISATEQFAMAAANAIPLGMDTFWPFKRNTPLGVEKAEYLAWLKGKPKTEGSVKVQDLNPAAAQQSHSVDSLKAQNS